MEEWFDENGDIIHEDCSVYEAARDFHSEYFLKML